MPQTQFERMELKFVISRAQRAALTDDIARHLAPDPYGDADGCYPTVDLYYDSPERDVYWQRWRGWPSRRKLRLRVYGSQSTAAEPASFLEIKHSINGRVAKRRAALRVPDAMAVCRGAPPPAGLGRAALGLIDEIQTFVELQGLEPAAVVRCERQAFVGRDAEADMRLTFDQHVAWRTRDLVPHPDDRDMEGTILGADPCVLEVKVDMVVPRWLAELVTRHGCLLQSHSKYGAAIAAALRQQASAPVARRETPPVAPRCSLVSDATVGVGMDALSDVLQSPDRAPMAVSAPEVVLALLLSTALMLVIAAVYQHTHRGLYYSQGYAHTLILMGALISVVIMVIGDNGGRALAVFGVFSFIRFRNLLPETRDVAYLFFAMVVGLAVGAQQYLMAIVTTGLVSILGLALWRTDSYAAARTSHILRVRVTNDIDFDKVFRDAFERLLQRSELQSVESVQAGMLTELSYAVFLKADTLPGQLVSEVQRLNGNNRVVLQAFGPNFEALRQADLGIEGEDGG